MRSAPPLLYSVGYSITESVKIYAHSSAQRTPDRLLQSSPPSPHTVYGIAV